MIVSSELIKDIRLRLLFARMIEFLINIFVKFINPDILSNSKSLLIILMIEKLEIIIFKIPINNLLFILPLNCRKIFWKIVFDGLF